MKIQGAIFDLDGTILDSMYVWRQIDVDFLKKRGFEVPVDYLEKILVLGSLEAANYTIERFGLNEKPEDILLEWLNMAIDEYANHVMPKKGAKEYLAFLKEAGIQMAVATSAEKPLFDATFKRLGLYEYFDAIVTTVDAGATKHEPDVYIMAAEKIGVAPEHCVVFEDIFVGIQTAKKAGFTTVAVEDKTALHTKEEFMQLADLYIKDFTQFSTDDASNILILRK